MAHKVDYSVSTPETIEAALGQQLEKLRLSRNISQAQLASDAGVSRRTITRLANGEGISMDTFIRVLQALGLANRLATLLPDPAARPVERVRLGGRERQRARASSKSDPATWQWAAGPDEQ